MVAMDEIVDAGEGPWDAQNGEQFAVQELQNGNSFRVIMQSFIVPSGWMC